MVLVNPEDARELRLADGDYVDRSAEEDGRGAQGARVAASCAIRRVGRWRRVLPETNVLVPLDATADTSNTPAAVRRGASETIERPTERSLSRQPYRRTTKEPPW
ncbi:hypothetical protein GCM10023238_15640 [Streptomyces heliomycini]